MNMTTFLLVATLALLFGPAALKPTGHTNANLNDIIDLTGTLNKTKYMDVFVEDLRRNDCVGMFFCKARDILRQHFNQSEAEGLIVRNLQEFIKSKELICPKEWKAEVGTITLAKLVDVLADRSRQTNLTGGKKSRA